MLSRSKSPSRSRSASRSKSRSPIRYRRDRSVSRSPIRYRRDRVSPSRLRDHYGYRSRSRRGYYRGRGDYSWNPYRRDWDREREREREYYPRSRRSRSRSRSRVRRRSRTRSRSPWHRREFTLSPRHRRDDLRSNRIPRRSKSKDPKESPSDSSRSGSRSPYKKGSSRSPKVQRDSALGVEELDDRDQERTLPLSSHGGEVEGHPDMKKQPSKKDSRQKELSMSPIRSLSISLSPSKGLHPTLNGVSQSKLEEGNNDQVWAGGEVSNDMLSISEVRVDSKEQQCSSPILTEESKTFKVSLRLKVAKQELASRQSRLFRRVERHGREIDVSASYESDDDNAVDDWRDDVKAHEHQKSRRRESKEPAQKAEESKPKVGGQCVAPLGYGSMPLLQQEHSTLDQSMGPAKRYQEEGDDEALPKKSVSFPLLGDNEKEASLVTSEVEYDVAINDRNSHQESGQGGVVGKVVAGNNTIKVLATDDGVVDHEDKEEEDEFVFEGPKPPCVAHDVAQSELEKDRENADHVKGKLLESEIGHYRDSRGRQHRNVMEDGHGQKVKGMSRSKDEKKQKEDADQRKERHRKHKRKNRREEDVDDEEDEDTDECDGRKEKKRCRKKHKGEEDDARRDRKKKKNKHCTKFASDLPIKSPIFSTGEAGDAHVSPVLHKKGPGRHKKRRRVSSKSLPGSASPTE